MKDKRIDHGAAWSREKSRGQELEIGHIWHPQSEESGGSIYAGAQFAASILHDLRCPAQATGLLKIKLGLTYRLRQSR